MLKDLSQREARFITANFRLGILTNTKFVEGDYEIIEFNFYCYDADVRFG
jgi:hypothetical protein